MLLDMLRRGSGLTVLASSGRKPDLPRKPDLVGAESLELSTSSHDCGIFFRRQFLSCLARLHDAKLARLAQFILQGSFRTDSPEEEYLISRIKEPKQPFNCQPPRQQELDVLHAWGFTDCRQLQAMSVWTLDHKTSLFWVAVGCSGTVANIKQLSCLPCTPYYGNLN